MTIASAVKRNKDSRPKPPPKVVEEAVQTDFDPSLDDEFESDDDGKSTFFHSISACDVSVQHFALNNDRLCIERPWGARNNNGSERTYCSA